MKQDSRQVWKRVSQQTVYKGRVHIVKHAAMLPNGERTTYEVDHSSSCAVATLMKTSDSKVVLSYQFRFPLNQWIYDLPGGASHEGETAKEAAIRECREEVGLVPRKIEQLAMFYPNPARTDWPAYVFYSDNFEPSELRIADPSETVEKVLMPIEQLHKLVTTKQIVDPMLLIAWYTACSEGYIKV